ncbi:MAG: Mur ligase family protein, partial [Oscillospiraceae bacterium]
WYAQLDCDIVVLETGLGGELDSTNVIPAPEVAVIASMALDHTDILGDTIELIAAAKSGIIKHGSAVASAANDSRAEAVITAACKRQGCELREVDCAALVIKKQTISETVFDYKEYKDLKIPLLGAYQPSNAALAIEAVQLLRLRGWPLGDAELREGLRSVSWPARFELLCEEPIFFLDGGHNPQGVKLARQSFESLLPGVRPTVLFGVMADKAIEEMIKELLPLASEFLCVVPGNPRALGNGALAQKIRDIGGIATECVSVADGVSAALERAKNSGAVLALGSLYMSGEILDCFDNK